VNITIYCNAGLLFAFVKSCFCDVLMFTVLDTWFIYCYYQVGWHVCNSKSATT